MFRKAVRGQVQHMSASHAVQKTGGKFANRIWLGLFYAKFHDDFLLTFAGGTNGLYLANSRSATPSAESGFAAVKAASTSAASTGDDLAIISRSPQVVVSV
jgi:hypothetical protein